MKAEMKKTAIVTGGSSGIGMWVARYLQKEGYEVYELSRHGEDQEGIVHIACDVSKEAAVSCAISQIIDAQDRLDLIVNCAGFGISGAIEYTEAEEAKRLFDVNFFGMVNVNRCCIPYLKKSRGRIINISSVAALAPIPFQAYYSASKAAVNSYTLALANELKPFGVSVCAIMPGDTATGFTAARAKNIRGDDEYNGRISASVARMEKDEQNGVSAEKVGKYIVSIAEKKKVRPLYTVGIDYQLITVLLKILPYRFSNYLLSRIY